MPTTAPENQHILPGLGIRLVAILLLSTMFVLVRVANDHGVHVLESLFYRFLFGFFFMILWIGRKGGFSSIETQKPLQHFGRAVLGIVAMGLNFWAYTEMPLAEAATISFTVPIIATVFSVIFLSEIVGARRWAAAIIGFLGILIVVQPGAVAIPLKGALIGISGAIFTALTFIVVRALGKTESSSTIVFWYTAFSVPIVGIALTFVAQTHSIDVWLLLVAIGVLGATGQLALAQSLRWAPVSAVMPMDYSHLIWSVLFGLAIWDEWPKATTWIGAAIIVASGIYVAIREHQLGKAERDLITPFRDSEASLGKENEYDKDN